MTVEGGEAAADAMTGAVAAATIEPEAGNLRRGREAEHAACLNCGAALTGRYCASCGQSARVHRSFRSLGHDILHSVLHFDGKFWRTIPELAFHPGRLTRRYIDGERAKFISPLALFLFTMFVMYGIFALLPGVDGNDPTVSLDDPPTLPVPPPVPGPGTSDLPADPDAPVASEGAQEKSTNAFTRAAQKLEENPDLVFYKMKSNGYKWSWLLVPLSIPFMWALFFWRREFKLYDHAVFVTYSISFMLILLIVSTLAQAAGAGGLVQAALLMVVSPLHLYKQLSGTYRLSRLGAVVRLFFVLVTAATVLSAFATMLLLLGALE